MVTLTQNSLPVELKRLPQVPNQLYLSDGHLEDLLIHPRLAIVGSRKATPYGRAVTAKLASELAARGVIIVSGLALGVDSIAHASCLDAGGTTIAVLPCGLDRIYPATHTDLGRRIIKSGGMIVTEYPKQTEPYQSNFLARNRIIAALSEGVLVTEAAARSGSLNTASHALDLGLPVLAVPGNITSPYSEGCNNLIKAGAIPVTSTDDVIKALSWKLANAEDRVIIAGNEAERTVLELIKQGTSDGNTLLVLSKLETSEFNRTLTMLEITGRIRPLGANHWSLA
ncbi:DNA-protecting protein DprA [Candidatus Saccharibacteria bacterium]|nr:DNA-protecting protein DprA [Candidatus Saccharibacteria bacterium]